MIQLPELQDVKLEFETEFNSERNQLIEVRKQNFTQQNIADWLGKSLRTIQHFEKGRNYDPFILTGYRVMGEAI
jgi:DNA-binding XRE family transcriptional regulator